MLKSTCQYVVTVVGDQPYRCHRDTVNGSHLCAFHQQLASTKLYKLSRHRA